MSWLSRRLMLLFAIIAVLIVLLITVVVGLNWITIIKRSIIGGVVFGLVGGIIGQLITYNLSFVEDNQISKSQDQVMVQQDYADEELEYGSEMSSLDFDHIDEKTSNVINKDSDKLAQIVKNMNK